MAGSTTQSMENLTAQGMDRHQMMMNTEVMKHVGIMNCASVREIMLQHERTFKEQVHDLHKLYEVQRFLMEKAKSKGVDGYKGSSLNPPPPPPACGNTVPEETIPLEHRRNMWKQVTTESRGAMAAQPAPSAEKVFPDKSIKLEETSKNSNSPARKRKIDLEQPPEDDSEDEMETSVDAINSSVLGSSREYYHGYPVLEKMIKSEEAPYPGPALKPRQQPAMESQPINVNMGESYVYTNHGDGSGRASFYPFQHGKAPSVPLNISKIEPAMSNLGHMNTSLPFPNSGSTNAGIGRTIQSSGMFLPQPDLINRASQEAGMDTHWFFQAGEGNIARRFLHSPLQQQQQEAPPHRSFPLPELSITRSHHPLNGVLQNPSHPENSHHNNKSPLISDWSKEQKPLAELLVGSQKDRLSFASAERSGDSSIWFPKELGAQSVGSMAAARLETRPSEGGLAMAGMIAPGMTVSNGTGSSQERDLSMWAAQNPVLQLPQPYQQPQIFQPPPQVSPPVSHGVWLPPPQAAAPSSLFSQVYGVHSSDSSQIGHRNELLLQRSHGELAGPWNMVGLGHFYSGMPSIPQKPPFKKPPKLILKNDGVGMELKLVSPDKEVSDKSSDKPLNSFKEGSAQDISRSLEKISAQKDINDVDQKVDRRMPFGIHFSSSDMQGREPWTSVGVPMAPKLIMSTASSSLTQEIMLPKEPPLLHDATTSGLPASQDRHGLLQLPGRGSDTQHLSCTESLKAAFLNEAPPLMGSSDINADMPDQKAERSLLLCKDDTDADHCSMADPEAAVSAEVVATSKASTKDMVGVSQRDSESPSVVPQGAPLKAQDETVHAASSGEKRVQKSDGNPCKEDEQPQGSHLIPCASTDNPIKDAAQSNGAKNDCVADLGIPSSTQADSIQSNTPSTPISDRDCSSTRSSTSLVPEGNTESKPAVSCDDLHLDFDTDNLAASILLSFAPKTGIPNREKHMRADARAMSYSSSRRDRPADQTSSNSRKDRPTSDQAAAPNRGAHVGSGLRTETLKSGGGRDRKTHGQGGSSSKRSDRVGRYEPPAVKPTRLRTEKRGGDDPETENGFEGTMKPVTIKLPRVAGMVNGEVLPMSRSKQLSKINGVQLNKKINGMTQSPNMGDRTTTPKMIDTFHTPTGRRSSRGPHMAARLLLHDSGRRGSQQQQSRHRLEASSNTTTERDSTSREEAAAMSRIKAEGSMKSRAWGEINKTRSHPRSNKQFHQEISQRKAQR